MERETGWLGLTPTVDSVDAAELALREVAAIRAEQTKLAAETEAKLRAINEAATADAVTIIDGTEQPFDVRCNELENAVLAWADANRETLCKKNAKSLKLRNGKVCWRKAKDAVEYLDDWKQADAVAKVVKKHGLAAMLLQLVERLNWFGIFEAKLSVNRTAAVKAVQKLQVNESRLNSIGLTFVEGEEYVAVEVAEFTRTGHTGSDAA